MSYAKRSFVSTFEYSRLFFHIQRVFIKETLF